jgi:hypothetical protein
MLGGEDWEESKDYIAPGLSGIYSESSQKKKKLEQEYSSTCSKDIVTYSPNFQKHLEVGP